MRVLITPLDWGLGHATRCIPIIRELQARGCEVILAGTGDSLALLVKEFPDMKVYSLPGYAPRYSKGGGLIWAMARQLPHFLRVISAEHRMVENIIDRERIALLISDNRYGCWSAKIPSVFITHQPNIMMPHSIRWLQEIVTTLNNRMMDRFDYCWIPDYPEHHSLAGDLIAFGTNRVKTKNVFVGWLSRFRAKENVLKKYDVVAIFSGPEPQRTLLENIVVPQLESADLTFRVIRGLPSATDAPVDARIVNFLSSDDLQRCIEAASLIIARSGYSTVMDMNALGKKVIFIPTPGQTEQEYLAERLLGKGIAFSMKQDQFDLRTALEKSNNFSGFVAYAENDLLRRAVDVVLDHARGGLPLKKDEP